MSFELTFAPVQVTGEQIREAAARYAGQPFALDGHYSHTVERELVARVDCVRLLLFAWRDCGLWPYSWLGELPRELRAIRLERANRLCTLDDYPVLKRILNANFDAVSLAERTAGDVLGLRLSSVEAIHHTGFVASASDEGSRYGSLWHVMARESVKWMDIDKHWNKRLVECWRLKPVAKRTVATWEA